MKWLYRTPWALIYVIFWVIARLAGAQFFAGNVYGLIFVLLGLGAMILEFQRSTDITVSSFKMDLGMSVLAIVITTAFTTWMITTSHQLAFADIVVWLVVFADAWSSPVSSFKCALRNITTDVGIGQSPPNEGGNQ
jgi:hypothetical protein